MLMVMGITALGLLGGAKLTRVAMAQGADPYRELDTLAQALNHIEGQYLRPVDSEKLIHGAIQGMTDVLDRHSVFLDPAALKEAQARTEGVYSGVGIELKAINKAITVVRIVPGSPADGKAERGDVLERVSGVPVTSLADAGDALRGPNLSEVTLTLSRAGQPQSITLERKQIRDRTVRVSRLGQGWAIAEIVRFQRNTATDLERGLRKISPKNGVIIDLRGNGGGLLEEAVDVVKLFANAGLIVQTKGRDGTTLESHSATKTAPYGHLNIIVLVDNESASASEIVAGALRTLCKATLVGTQTYGKWSVQRLYVFESKSAIKLTIAHYEIADPKAGTDKVGLSPDIVVEAKTPTSTAVQALKERLNGDPVAQAHLAQIIGTLSTSPNQPILAPLKRRLTLDPQLKAAWTLARTSH
jgi:carboxyl-terminal processing protease